VAFCACCILRGRGGCSAMRCNSSSGAGTMGAIAPRARYHWISARQYVAEMNTLRCIPACFGSCPVMPWVCSLLDRPCLESRNITHCSTDSRVYRPSLICEPALPSPMRTSLRPCDPLPIGRSSSVIAIDTQTWGLVTAHVDASAGPP
jgi:hypothetical protein